jgi:hypothetical protein
MKTLSGKALQAYVMKKAMEAYPRAVIAYQEEYEEDARRNNKDYQPVHPDNK